MNLPEPARQLIPPCEAARTLNYYTILISDWEFVVGARFTQERIARVGYTGDSYRYEIYRKPHHYNSHGFKYAMRWSNGGGAGWLVGQNCLPGEVCILRMISEIPSEDLRWDCCHQLWQCAHYTESASIQNTEIKWGQAIVNKKLKKKKLNGAYRFWIEE